MGYADSDREAQTDVTAFRKGLQKLGWAEGRNISIETRWATPENAGARERFAKELVALQPDLDFCECFRSDRQRLRSKPVAAGRQRHGFHHYRGLDGRQVVGVAQGDFAACQPGRVPVQPGNGDICGILPEPLQNCRGISGKWMELLKEIAPNVTRVAVLRDPTIAAGAGQLGAIQSVAPSFGVELLPVGVRDIGEIERGIMTVARAPRGGLIVTATTQATVHRDLIIALAARNALPAVYSERAFVASGGLLSYGPNRIDSYRNAAAYIDRILKGGKPADLPVQAPTKYELVIKQSSDFRI